MPRIIIDIKTDNAAFEDDFDGALKYVLDRVQDKAQSEQDFNVMDPNGNICAFVEVRD